MSKVKNNLIFNSRIPTKLISLRMPRWLIEALKYLANKKDVPYQSLMKIFLAERVEKELKLSK